MKKISTLSSLVIFCLLINAQKYEWLSSTEATAIPNGTLVATDGVGNIYTTGTYQGTLYIGGDTLNSYGLDDSYLAKLDATGNYIWIQAIGHSGNDSPLDIEVDAGANIYLTMSNHYGGVINTHDSAVNTGNNAKNLFCFDSSGAFKWFKLQSGGNLYMATAANTAGVYLTDNNSVQRINAQGNTVWQKAVINSLGNSPFLTAVEVSESGKLAIAGYTVGINGSGGTVTFDTVVLAYPNENFGRFVFYGDTSGTAYWGNEIGHNVSNGFQVSSMEISNTTGDLYAGTYEGGALYYFANDTIVNPVSPGEGWAGVLKFNAQGAAQWMRVFYAVNADIYDFVLTATDEVVMVGGYSNSAYGYFGPFTLPDAGLNPFISKLNSAGNYLWVKIDPRTVNNVPDFAHNIAILPGNKYAVGGIWYNFFGGLNPYQQGCHAYTPIVYPRGHFVEVISENAEPVPSGDFSILQSGNTFLFKNITDNSTSQWTFGDGGNSVYNEPIHTYAQSGVYNVCLNATNNCGTGQTCNQVVVKGIREIVSNQGIAGGVVTANIYGGSFTSNTTVLLKKSGSGDIVPYYTRFINNGNIEVRLDLTGAAQGSWDVEVTVPADTVMTLVNGFTITPPQPIVLEFVAGGSRVSRTNRWSPTVYTIYNHSGTDAVGVPVMFRYHSAVSEFDMIQPVNAQQVPFLNSGLAYLQSNSLNTNVLSKAFADANSSSVITAFVIPLVKANSAVSFSTFLNSSSGIEMFNGGFAVYPLLTSTSLTGVNAPMTDVCFGSFLKNGIEKTLSITISAAHLNTCYSALNDSLLSILAVEARDSSAYNIPLSLPAIVTSMLTHLASTGCVTGIPSVLTNVQIETVINKTLSNIIFANDIDSIAAICPAIELLPVQHTSEHERRTNEFCDIIEGAVISPFSSLNKIGALFCKFFGDAIDPNQKSGPGDNEDDIWLKPSVTTDYTIAFENIATATAPASMVTLLDTLDASRFDFSTFRFGPIAIGDSVKFEFAEPGNTQIRLTSLSPVSSDYLRTEATFDTATGIVKWIFTTVDPVNYQPDTIGLNGFLPPNANGTEGTGYTSFAVKLKSSLITGDSVINRASIVFDANAPIVTNDWINVIDITKPQSSVNTLPATTPTDSFWVSWSGSDVISGINTYDIYVSINDQPYELWQNNTIANQAMYYGNNGDKYEFYSRAVDRAGNIEDAPANPESNPDAVTTVLLTGINEIIGDFFTLLPNPVSSELTIRSSEDMTYLKVTDAFGKEVVNYPLTATSNFKLQTLNFPTGIYFIEIISHGEKGVAKFLKVE